MKSTLKRLVTCVADRAGYEVLPKWRLDRLELARHLAAVFERYAVDCVLDVGANTGDYGRFIRQEVGYTGRIVSVEPVSNAFAELKACAEADSNWAALRCALGPDPGEAVMNVTANSQFASRLQPDNTLTPQYNEMNRVVRTEIVPMRRVDDLIGHEVDARNLYLKLDTQGTDLEVFSGATSSLEYIRALQSEVSVIPIYRGMPDYLTAIRTFTNFGYAISGLFPVNRDAKLRVVEFDCVMVKP